MLIGKPGPAKTHICRAHADRIEVRGHDLTSDLMGRLSFTDYFYLLMTGREPSANQRYFLDLLLVAIAEHGLTPTAIAARMTYDAAPGLAAGRGRGRYPRLRHGRPRHVRALRRGAGRGRASASSKGVDAERPRSRRSPAKSARRGEKMPGFGHPVHHPVDPRAERILALAAERGVAGRHIELARLFRARGRRGLGPAAADERLDADRRLPARPRLSGEHDQGDPDPCPHRRAARPSRRGAALADRLPDGLAWRGGHQLRGRCS